MLFAHGYIAIYGNFIPICSNTIQKGICNASASKTFMPSLYRNL